MEFFGKQHYDPKDKFVSVMGDFCTVAAYNFLEVEETYADMKQKVMHCLRSWHYSKKTIIYNFLFSQLIS